MWFLRRWVGNKQRSCSLMRVCVCVCDLTYRTRCKDHLNSHMWTFPVKCQTPCSFCFTLPRVRLLAAIAQPEKKKKKKTSQNAWSRLARRHGAINHRVVCFRLGPEVSGVEWQSFISLQVPSKSSELKSVWIQRSLRSLSNIPLQLPQCSAANWQVKSSAAFLANGGVLKC